MGVIQGMHVSPAKHSAIACDYQEKRDYKNCDYRQTERQTDGRTDVRAPNLVTPLCLYTSHSTKKTPPFWLRFTIDCLFIDINKNSDS